MRLGIAMVLLLLSGLWPALATAATCMNTVRSGSYYVFVQGNQTNPAACAYVAISGSEWAQYQADATRVAQLESQVAALQSMVGDMNGYANEISTLQAQVGLLSSVYPTLSLSEAGQIGGAILLVWGIAFGFRALARSYFSQSFDKE